MRVFGDEYQLCPCYKECQEFQKLVELKDSGLVVYYHRPRKEDIRHGEAVESAVNTSSDIFILHNKEDESITTSVFLSELEKKNISCPRCRKTFKHAQKLMQEVKLIDRKIVMGICDHCRKKAQTMKKPFCPCDEIVKKFISVKGEQKEDFKKPVKIGLSKVGHAKDNITLNKQKQIKTRAYSELQINQGLNSPASRHEPEVQQMFYSGKHQSDINLNTVKRETRLKEGLIKQAVAFFQPSEHLEKTFAHKPRESQKINTMNQSTSLVDSDTTFVEESVSLKELPIISLKERNQEEVFEDRPSMDAKEALKRRHDFSLRQMMRLEKDSGVPYTVPKRPVIYETPKFPPWEHNEPTSKYHVESEMDIKIPIPTKTKHDLGRRCTRDVEYVSNRILKSGASRTSQRNLQDSYSEPRKVDKYQYDTRKIKQGLYDSEQGPKKVKKLGGRYIISDEKLKLQRSLDKICHTAKKPEQHVAKSKSLRLFEPQFSFLFPKLKEKEESEINLNVSSSQLIKDTQEKFRLQAERLKKIQEEERQQQGLSKKLSREEKKKYVQDQNRQSERDTSKEDDLEKDGVSEKSKKDVKGKSKPKEKGDDKGTEKGGKKLKGIPFLSSNIQNTINTENEKIYKKKEESKGNISTEESSKVQRAKELQAEHLKEKAEADLKKKKIELELQTRKAKEAEHKAKISELKMSNNKIQKESAKSVRSSIKQEEKRETKKAVTKIRPYDIDSELIKAHNRHHLKSGQRSSFCPLCLNSELELEVLSLVNKRNLTRDKITDIIIGEKIFKHKPRVDDTKQPEGVPLFFQKVFGVESDLQTIKENVQIIPQESKNVHENSLVRVISKKDNKEIEMKRGIGGMRYALSDRTFIEKGWTMLPTEKVLRKMNVYRMRPAHPEFDWFEHNKNKQLMTYDSGERLAEFDDNGRGRWYYRNGRLALDYYDAKETNAQQRFVIYSSGEPDERGRTHPITTLATFDYLGNGIVFDHAGKIRLNYNQSEGVVLDRAIGPVSHWKWHSLNDPPVLQKVMIDTQMAQKDPNILKLGLAEKEDTEATRPVNEEIDGSTNLKLNIGMILDHQEIVDTDIADMGEVSNSLKRFPARTDSLAGLQRSVAHAQRYERQRAERERWLRPPQPCASVDHLTAAASPPLRLPLRTIPTASSSSTGYSSRKPTNSVCCNTRLRF